MRNRKITTDQYTFMHRNLAIEWTTPQLQHAIRAEKLAIQDVSFCQKTIANAKLRIEAYQQVLNSRENTRYARVG